MPYNDIEEMLDRNDSTFAFLFPSQDVQGIVRTVEVLAAQLDRRDEVGISRSINLATSMHLSK